MFTQLNWGTNRREHVARHQIGEPEVEEAVFEDPDRRLRRGPRSERQRTQFLYYVYGRTTAGRYLFVVLLPLAKEEALVITAREMTPREQQYYERG